MTARIFSLLLLALLPALAWSQDVVPVACCGAQEVAQDDAPKYGKGYKPLTPEQRTAFYALSHKRHGHRLAMMSKFQDLPPAFDARDKGWILPVGDQANCGSCYLYSTIYGTLTQAFVKAGYGKADGSFVMAVQYGMDCHNFGGCNGGNGTEVIEWVIQNGWYAEKWVDVGGASHADYPTYEARSRTCRKVPGAKLWKPASWGFVSTSSNRPATTLEIKTAVYNFGGLNVSLDAGGQFGNGTGTITALGNAIDHEIELVAYDDNKDGGAFLLKNQWDTSWGNGGYRWVTYKAAQHLVDVFFVTAAELPPPPPPLATPVITSPLTSNAVTGQLWTYQITATNNPTSYATPGNSFTVSATGLVSGTVKTAGSYNVPITATNASGTGTATLALTVTDKPVPPPVPIGVEITISKDLKAGKYEIHPAGTKAKLDAWEAWWQSRPSAPQADKLAPMPKESSGITANDIRIIAARVAEFERRVDLLLASVP